MGIYYIDRKTGEMKQETVAGNRFLDLTYNTKLGQSFLELLIKRKMFSSIYGKLQDTKFSSRKISKFVNELDIDLSEAIEDTIDKYNTFNDFFTRKLKNTARVVDINKESIIAPADGKILAYENIDIEKVVQVKGLHYKLKELIQDDSMAAKYNGGTCVLIRLAPADYHRFHFPDWGIPETTKQISGHYYSVNPISLSKISKVYCQNKRELTIFNSESFSKILLIEVGATCVGSIIQTFTPFQSVDKGQEKGYFKFGGSTVIMFLEKNTIKIDDDILQNTSVLLETKVNMGESIGYLIK